jgi:hypothetical protein
MALMDDELATLHQYGDGHVQYGGEYHPGYTSPA